MSTISKSNLEINKNYQHRRRRSLGVPSRDQLRKNHQQDFIENALKIHADKYCYDKVKYVTSIQKVTITCPEHGDFEQTPSAHKRGQGCPDCAHQTRKASRKRKTTKQFISEAQATHGNVYDYSRVKYTSIQQKVIIRCLDHGMFEQQAKAHLRGQGCPECANQARASFYTSKGEQLVMDYLQKHNVVFTTQKTFKDCKYKLLLRYDFFVPDHSALIEYDGEQHFTYIPRFHGSITGFEQYKHRDLLKEQYASSNGYKLLRIPWTENDNIPDLISSFLF